MFWVKVHVIKPPYFPDAAGRLFIYSFAVAPTMEQQSRTLAL